MAILYKIAEWNERFENNRTRDMKKMQWVPIPNRHDGDSFTALMERDDGAAMYGAWCLIVQVASKCGERGTLLRDSGIPHTGESLARITRADKDLMKEALGVLVSIGWITENEYKPQEGAEIPQSLAESTHPHARDHARAQNGTEGNGTEGNEQLTSNRKADSTRAEAGLSKSEVLSAWNALRKPFSLARWTPKREKAFKSRAGDSFFVTNWEKALAMIRESSFCKGSGERSWIADFDFFLRPDTVTKILEGKYNGSTRSTKKRAGAAESTPGARSQLEQLYMDADSPGTGDSTSLGEHGHDTGGSPENPYSPEDTNQVPY